MSLTSILDRVASLDGVRAVVLAGRDGLPIAQTPRAFDYAESLAAYGANAMGIAYGLGAATHRAALIGVICEYQDFLVSIDPVGDFAVTVTLLDGAAAIVSARMTLRQLRGELLTALDVL